jgi:hypothetical protein
MVGAASEDIDFSYSRALYDFACLAFLYCILLAPAFRIRILDPRTIWPVDQDLNPAEVVPPGRRLLLEPESDQWGVKKFLTVNLFLFLSYKFRVMDPNSDWIGTHPRPGSGSSESGS